MRYNLTPQVPNLEPYIFLLTSCVLCYNLTPQVPNLESYTFLLTPHAYPNGGDVQKCVLNPMFKFDDDPMVNKSRIVVLQE